jgi:NTE family protein
MTWRVVIADDEKPARDRLRRLIADHVEFEDLADSAIPLHVVTFDVERSEEVVLSSGSAVDALTAAASIPGVLPPVAFGERRLVDGGVVNNTPVSCALALGARRIFILPTRAVQTPGVLYRHGGLGQSAERLPILTARRLAGHLARYSAEIVPLPAPNPRDIAAVDFTHAERLIADATAAARLRLDEVLDHPPFGSRGPRRLARVNLGT